MRLRIPMPPKGTVWSIREAARQLKVDDSVVRYQKGKGAVKAGAGGEGVDAVSACEWFKGYEPHADNAVRRVRGRTLVEGAPAGAPKAALSGARGRAPALALGTGEWVERFYADRCRGSGGTGHGNAGHVCAINRNTLANYATALGRFAAHFPMVPLETIGEDQRITVTARRAVLEWLHGLRDGAKPWLPAGPGIKDQIHKIVSAFYHWLATEHGLLSPSLAKSNLPPMQRTTAVLYPEQVRRVMEATRDHTEYTVVVLLAQTAARRGELVTLRPECLQPYWSPVWGKTTRANAAGYRPLCLPDEAYEHLQTEYRVYGELMLRGRPLAGPLAPAVSGRRINLEDRHTFTVHPLADAQARIDNLVERLLRDAGVWEPGMGCHAFRRGYEAEWLKNGGSKSYMDLVMGHGSMADMSSLYLHEKADVLAAEARKYAPRRFLARDPQVVAAA